VPPVSATRVSLPARYRVVRHIANGGMASVWEAHDELLDRSVAVKLLAPHLSEDERARIRFQREARTAAGLSSHPHVVTIYDVGEHDGRSFIVMELMRGGSVGDRLRRGDEIPRQSAIRWLREGASALDAAHERGIVHRDVKPANMLLDEKDRLALADFGIARIATEDQLTMTGQVLGTAAYISPEQAMGQPASDASDRYSFAVVAYELLTGARPFVAEHYAAQARAHVEDPPPPASQRRPALPPEVDRVLDRAMAKEPYARYLTATAFVGALEAALDAQRPQQAVPVAPPSVDPTLPLPPVAASPGTAAEPVGAGTGGGEPPLAERRAGEAPPGLPPSGRRRRRAPVALIGALLALLLAGGAAAALLAGQGDGGEDPGQAAAERSAAAERRAQERREREATPTPSPTPTAEATAEATAPATPTPTPSPEPEATAEPPAQTPAPTGEPDLARASRLNDQGYSLFRQGDYASAVPLLRESVAACGNSTALDPCGFALYNLGASLRRSGNPDEAIPFLERRLNGGFEPNQIPVVRRELRLARQEAREK